MLWWLRADDPTPADGEVVPLRSSIELEGPYSELRAFVAGATGGTGQAIVRRLVAEGVPVRALGPQYQPSSEIAF